MTVYAFVDAQKTDFTITTLCRVCGVSTSGFYDWAARVAAGPSNTERDDAEVLERIRVAHRNSKGRYGEPRITAQLARDGVAVSGTWHRAPVGAATSTVVVLRPADTRASVKCLTSTAVV